MALNDAGGGRHPLLVRDPELPQALETLVEPLARGDLLRGVRGRPLPEWAHESDCASWSQLFLKYILAEPALTCVIPATGNPEHMTDNLAAGSGGLPDARQRRNGAR